MIHVLDDETYTGDHELLLTLAVSDDESNTDYWGRDAAVTIEVIEDELPDSTTDDDTNTDGDDSGDMDSTTDDANSDSNTDGDANSADGDTDNDASSDNGSDSGDEPADDSLDSQPQADDSGCSCHSTAMNPSLIIYALMLFAFVRRMRNPW